MSGVIPSPALFSDWKEWANALKLVLDAQRGEYTIALQHEVSTALPPATIPGVLIYVKDLQEVRVSTGTTWVTL